MRKWLKVALLVGAVLFVNGSALADLADCNASFTECSIPENVMQQLPFFAIAGDVILLDPNSSDASDVFRIFNNVFDTGGGTGLGDLAFLYSSDDGTPLPNPSSYSLNAITIPEALNGPTSYNGNGTLYMLGVPEPSGFGLLAAGILTILILLVKTKCRPRFRHEV